MKYNFTIGRNAADAIAEMIEKELIALGEWKPTEKEHWTAYRRDLEAVLAELEKRKEA